ncbi:MAG TPA: hypothetical protein ENI75_01220 [Mizugakiibacter sp.]|nr:hypothetical protein [Mizugakiibacter sp.]
MAKLRQSLVQWPMSLKAMGGLEIIGGIRLSLGLAVRLVGIPFVMLLLARARGRLHGEIAKHWLVKTVRY